MTDTTNVRIDDMDDLELLTSALNGHLDPERVEQVRRRLEEDPVFREFAAPMLLTWSVPKHLERHPRPVGELENAWNAFAERNGIAQPPVQRGRRWHPLWRRFRILFLFMLLLPLTPLVTYALMGLVPMGVWEWMGQKQERITDPGIDPPVVEPLRASDDTTWLTVGVGVQVRPGADAVLTQTDRRVNGKRQLSLERGTVRVRLAPITVADPSIRRHTVDVRTPAGIVSAGESEFTVTARGDTTEVEVHSAGRPSTTGRTLQPVSAAVEVKGGADDGIDSHVYHVPLGQGQRTRIVRNEIPALYRRIP